MDREEKIALAIGLTFFGVAVHGKGQSISITQPPTNGATVANNISSSSARMNAPFVDTIGAGSFLDLPAFAGNLCQVTVHWAYGAAVYYMFDDGSTQVIRQAPTTVTTADITVTFGGTKTPRVNNVSGSGYQVMIQYTEAL